MSATQALRAVAGNGRCPHRTQSSSQELHHTNVPQNDELAAAAEANSERDAGVGTKGLPGPGGGRKSTSIQANNVTKNRLTPDATTGETDRATSTLADKSTNVSPTGELGVRDRRQASTRASSRHRVPPQRLASDEQIPTCVWKKTMDLLCTNDCDCGNSIPRQEEERVSLVRGLDVAEESWGVVANRDIQSGDIITVFGGTTYLPEASSTGTEFSRVHVKLHGEGTPLQYSFHGHLAESSTAKIWAIPELDKQAIRNRADISRTLRRVLCPGGDEGIGQMINHTCCEIHRNAEFRLTRAISGDPRKDSTDEEGRIVLAIRACRDIKQHETILVHYNPGAGIDTWNNVFKCGCCQCRGVCRPPAPTRTNVEMTFRTTIAQDSCDEWPNVRETKVGDFVKTHEDDFWGNVVRCGSGDMEVRGFCTRAKKLIHRTLSQTRVVKHDPRRWWTTASTAIRSTALARIWEPNSPARGGWLEDGTVDTVIRWSLYGDTNVGGLAPNPTRAGYVPCSTFQELRDFLNDMRQTAGRAESPLLKMALEGLTGLHGCYWKDIESSQSSRGIELKIPALQHALEESLTLPTAAWQGMDVSGLQSHHYVRVGNRILGPRRQRNHPLVKWLKTYGWRMDLTALDHLFATVHSENHYFIIHWSKTTEAFTVRDSLASHTKPVHKEATVLLWAILLASARADKNLWQHEPVLALSEDQVLGEFRELLLKRPGHRDWHSPITEEEQENLRRMGIRVQANKEIAKGAWRWQRDADFPQQSNGVDCGMVAIAATTHLARGWQVPNMRETEMTKYRRWLFQTIMVDSEDYFEMPCSRCGMTQYRKQVSAVTCPNKGTCDFARANLHDVVICEDQSDERRGTTDTKRLGVDEKRQVDNQQQHTARRSTRAAQCQAQRAADKDMMIVDPPPKNTSELDPSSVTELQGEVVSSGKGAVPETTNRESTPVRNKRGAAPGTSSGSEQSPEGKSARHGWGRHQGSSGQSQRPAQVKKRQQQLTDGFMIKLPNQQHAGSRARTALVPIPTPRLHETRKRNTVSCSKWVCHSLWNKQSKANNVLSGMNGTEVCAGCSQQLPGTTRPQECPRCRTVKYCNGACMSLHWAKGHRTACKPGGTWCPACGEDVDAGSTMRSPCDRCKEVVYCSTACLNSDFNNHLFQCPLVSADTTGACETQVESEVDGGRVQVPTLMQPGGHGQQRGILVDDDETIARVRNERWQLSKTYQPTSEEDDKHAVKCEEARDRVLDWCVSHNPRSNLEAWRAEKQSAKAITELLREITGESGFTCSSEMWKAAIGIRDELLIPLAKTLGEERGQRIWTQCIAGKHEVRLCFQGIQASSKHQAMATLEEAGIEATEAERARAKCIIRRRRGARPPLAAMTVTVRPNRPLHQLLLGHRTVGHHKPEIWICREDEELRGVTTLTQDPITNGHCLRSWTKMYDMLGVPEPLQRELVLLSVMLQQPSFEPLDVLIGRSENPCSLAEVWKTKGRGSGPIYIAGNHALVTPGNAYAANESCAIAGKECYEGRKQQSTHACLHRGAQASTSKVNIHVGIPEWSDVTEKWLRDQSTVTEACSTKVQNLVAMIPEWWARCKVRMRWEMCEQGSAREKDSTVCIRITQTITEGSAANRPVTARKVEDELLTLVNSIREQCFQHAEDFVSGDIRYQGFEDREGLGRGMITIHRRKVSLFDVDVAIGCLLGFYLGNGIRAGGGRAHKWCPFWGKLGATSAKVTSITRASDYYSKARTNVHFGSQTRGREGWTVTNPKEKMVRRMLQLLHKKAGSGPMLALLRMPVWEPHSRMFRMGRPPAATAHDPSAPTSSQQADVATRGRTSIVPVWWNRSRSSTEQCQRDADTIRLLRWTRNIHHNGGRGSKKPLLVRKQEYLQLGGDRAGCNAVLAEQGNAAIRPWERQYWGYWAEAAKCISEFWLAEENSRVPTFLQSLREQGKIGLANFGESNHSTNQFKWWLQWLEWESLWTTTPQRADVLTWNIGPQAVDLSFHHIEQTLAKGAAVVMLQEVSFHPGERRRIKGILKKIGSDYWCVMETSQRVRAGREETKVGISNKNFASPWVYSVVTFLHRDVFKRPIRVDWSGQYTRKTLKYMLGGRMSCLWAPRHSEAPMLVVNIHQAGSATRELQQHVWMALQAVRARYPEAQGIIAGDFNANAQGNREGYSRSNEKHMQLVDNQFQACVAAIKGTLISPRTPSWIDTNTEKGARLDHLVGLGVEFACSSGNAAWVGSPFHDHARVSFAVNIGTLKPKTNRDGKREGFQKMTTNHWQGISHIIDEPLRRLAVQSLDRLHNGGGDADLERRLMLNARIEAAKQAMPNPSEEGPARMPFRNKQQQALLRARSRMEAALREVRAKRGLSVLQLACMHDLGITSALQLSPLDKESLMDTPQWQALLTAEILSNKSKLDNMVQKQTRQCEYQAKRKEAREYLRDKKGPSKFCGNMQSSQVPKELVQSLPVGVLWISQGPLENTVELITKIQEEIPSAEIQRTEGEVALLLLTVQEERATEGAALMKRAQRLWQWRAALRTPQRFLTILRELCLQRGLSNPAAPTLRQLTTEVVKILWEGQKGHRHAMTIGNAGSQHRGEYSWWAQGPGCLDQIQEWQTWVQDSHTSSDSEPSTCITCEDSKLSLRVEGGLQLFSIAMHDGSLSDTQPEEPNKGEPITQERPQHAQEASENKPRSACPFTKSETWHGFPGTLEVAYIQVKQPLDWETLARIARDSGGGPTAVAHGEGPGVQMTEYPQTPQGLPQKDRPCGPMPSATTMKMILDQGPWNSEELTMAWEKYMQTEGLSQHVCCEHCASKEKPIVVVIPGKMEQRRQLVCFCTTCWSFTSRHHCRHTSMDVSFFKQFNPTTGKFHRALPYAEDKHPRRIRGPVTDHELDQFRQGRLKLCKTGGPDKSTNELFRSLTSEELAVVREWADRVLQDAQSASSVLTDDVMNCSIRLLHKGGDTSDKPSDWRPIGLLNVGIQLIHHVINARLTNITEVENLIVPGQDGGRAGRGVDLNQLKLDWITSEAQRLKQRVLRIDIDFKNAFNSMSQSALWAVMRAYNIPDVDLLEAVYSRTTACIDPENARCATITFLTGVIQGGASSPRIFIVFINALLEHLTGTGQTLGISHGIEETEQFNNVAFMDDVTVLAQGDGGGQILLDATREFETWSNTKLNIGKTVVVDIDGGRKDGDPPKLTYNQQPIRVFQATESCRHLGFWATPNGDMTVTKQRVITKTREVLGLLMHHPLETKTAKELFQSMAVSVFRFSAAQVQWSQSELDQLQSLWLQAYKRAEHLANGTANEVFTFPGKWGGEELSTPVNIIAQELCNNITRCLVHDDVAKSITIQELQRAKDEWMCHTVNELYDEMELWTWNAVQHNRWARALKASNRVGVRPLWHLDESDDGSRKVSWATATRSLRKLKARIVNVGGKREQPSEQAWRLEDVAQWELLFRGEEVFWKVAGAIRRAGYDSILSLTQEPIGGGTTPALAREGESGSRGTKHLRLLIPRGIIGVTEDERATLQAWLELVDWTGLGVLPNSQVPRTLKFNIDSASEMCQWLTETELKCGVKNQESAQLFTDNQRELTALAKAIRDNDPNAVSRVEGMSGGEALGAALIMWLKNDTDEIEVAKSVVKMVWPRMGIHGSLTHPGWVVSCDTKLDLVAGVESWQRTNITRCAKHLLKLTYRCPGCQHGTCTVCNDEDSRTQCPQCREPIQQIPKGHQFSDSNSFPGAPCLNLHALGEQWIEEVTDVDFVCTSKAEHREGEHLKFKAHIRGWRAGTRERRCQQLLQKPDHALRRALLSATWKDILLVPPAWYPDYTPKYETPGWWYVPAEEVLGRTCKSCHAFRAPEDFTSKKRKKTVPESCIGCQTGDSRANTRKGSGSPTRGPRKRSALLSENSTLRCSARLQGTERVHYHERAESETRSDSDDDGSDAQLSYGLKMRAADPRYITRGDDKDRGDMILTIAQVRELLLRKQQLEEGVATVWLTTAEMGFSLTEEPHEILCPKDVKEGKNSDRFLAPAISRFATNAPTKNGGEADRSQQAQDVWQELTQLHQRWGKITRVMEDDNIRAQASRDANVLGQFTRIVRRKDLPWERDSYARAAYDPAHIPDCNVQASVGKHFLFNGPIPKGANGQGYLRVTKKSLWWQHELFPTVWTAEGLSTCMETGYQWTINSTTWNHLQAMWRAPPLDLLRLIHEETHHQAILEAGGYRSPTWRTLRALTSIFQANVVVGESMITAAPFFEGAGRPSKSFWGPQQGRRVILWESLCQEDQEKCLSDLQSDQSWVIWCKAKPKDVHAQLFREYGKCIFVGKCTGRKKVSESPAESAGGKHVTRARGWWKRGDVAACAAQTNMHCWVHRDVLVNEEQAETHMREAWEHEDSKDELNIVLQGLEQHFWKGTEAGRLGCYESPIEGWAGDGSANKGIMGAGCVCYKRPERNLVVRVGREEEGVSSLRAELAAMARALQAAALEDDLLYLCDSEAALNKVSRWIGSGPRTTLAGDANEDIMISIIERIRERVLRGARTFLVKVKAHRGEPLNERADTQAELARQLPQECRQWTTRTQRMTYEWRDTGGVKHVTTWSKAVRNAMVRGGAEFHRQKTLNHAGRNWKNFLGSTDTGLHRIRQAASMGAQSDLMDSTRWGWSCMAQLQEMDNWEKPAATTWAAEFLLREGESREFLGSWINSNAVHEAKKRRAKQVISCSFPCGKWLHMIKARASPQCELCKRERSMNREMTEALPIETLAHIQSAGCTAQKKSVIGAHNRCWKYLVGAISMHGEATRDLEFIGGDKDKQLETLWVETKIGDIFPWDDIAGEAERLLAQETDPEVDRDDTDEYTSTVFGRRRPDSMAVDWSNKTVYVLEFKRTSDQRKNYRERGEARARAQHEVLVKSLEKVAGEAVGEHSGWKVKLLIFVGGTCGSVHVQTFNGNLRELGVLESKRNAVRKGLVHELLNAQDKVLCSYFAQRSSARGESGDRDRTVDEALQGLDSFE